MIKCTIASGTSLTASSAIALTQDFNTAPCILSYSTTSTAVIVKKPGQYRITANLPVTGASATPISLQVFANGIAIQTAIDGEEITATTGTVTLQINDVVNVVSTSSSSEYLNLTFKVSGAATTAGVGSVVVERL